MSTDIIKGDFKSESNGGFLLSQKDIPHNIIAHTSKQLFLLRMDFFWRSTNLPVSSDLKTPLRFFFQIMIPSLKFKS